MADFEGVIEKLEREFPSESGAVFAAARERVLASGQTVLQSENGVLYELFPDGTKRLVKNLDPPLAVTPGTKIQLW